MSPVIILRSIVDKIKCFFQENIISFSNLEQLCSEDKLKACLPNSHLYHLILVGGAVGGVTQIILINNITYPHLSTRKP